VPAIQVVRSVSGGHDWQWEVGRSRRGDGQLQEYVVSVESGLLCCVGRKTKPKPKTKALFVEWNLLRNARMLTSRSRILAAENTIIRARIHTALGSSHYDVLKNHTHNQLKPTLSLERFPLALSCSCLLFLLFPLSSALPSLFLRVTSHSLKSALFVPPSNFSSPSLFTKVLFSATCPVVVAVVRMVLTAVAR
jgi:hypothetical protein